MDGTYRWAFPVTFPSPGRYTARFTADMGATLVGACAFDVADTGPPPDLPGPSCATRVCGESDGAGGTCTRCPIEVPLHPCPPCSERASPVVGSTG